MLQCCCVTGCDVVFDSVNTVGGAPGRGCPRVYSTSLGVDLYYIFYELIKVITGGPMIGQQIQQFINSVLEYTGADDFSLCGSKTSIKFGFPTSGAFSLINIIGNPCGSGSNVPVVTSTDGSIRTFTCCLKEVAPGVFAPVAVAQSYTICTSPPSCPELCSGCT